MSDTHTDELSEIMDVKEPITYDEQVKRIAAKDFIVENPDSCKEFLKQANYYSLLAYYLPFKKKDGTVESRIKPTLDNGSIVTDTRANVHYFVTEYGIVNLKGLSAWQKTEAIISVAHPDFRDQLIKEAEKMHIWKRSNKR